tara:strand:- start:1316 stop:1612 length:297 start_codon:yes stop_codon:yes gene_type:complete
MNNEQIRELERAEEIGYTLSIEEIRKIQKEEIRIFIRRWLYTFFWVSMLLVMNYISFSIIAGAHNDTLIELKALAFIFNYSVNVGGHYIITQTMKEGK